MASSDTGASSSTSHGLSSSMPSPPRLAVRLTVDSRVHVAPKEQRGGGADFIVDQRHTPAGGSLVHQVKYTVGNHGSAIRDNNDRLEDLPMMTVARKRPVDTATQPFLLAPNHPARSVTTATINPPAPAKRPKLATVPQLIADSHQCVKSRKGDPPIEAKLEEKVESPDGWLHQQQRRDDNKPPVRTLGTHFDKQEKRYVLDMMSVLEAEAAPKYHFTLKKILPGLGAESSTNWTR